MKIPEGWPTDEMLFAALEACDDMFQADFIRAFKAALAAAPTPPVQDVPVAWIIDYICEGHKRRAIFGHNAIADYRDIDPNATSTPLYTHPTDDKLRKAAEELHAFLSQLKPNMHNWLSENNYMHLMENLRAALEGK